MGKGSVVWGYWKDEPEGTQGPLLVFGEFRGRLVHSYLPLFQQSRGKHCGGFPWPSCPLGSDSCYPEKMEATRDYVSLEGK